MLIDRDEFFSDVRASLFSGRMTAKQVDGIENILDEWELRGLKSRHWLAYMLATVYHETAGAMQPVKERGGQAYLRAKPYWPWIGMGLVQVTWRENAKKFGAEKPEDLLSWPVALRAMFDGMIKGMFTGKKLADYFSDSKNDPTHARRIINGMDRASEIASIHRKFYVAI